MNPCALNVLITAITNYLYTTLSRDDFVFLSAFLNELTKSMFSTTLFQDLCDRANANTAAGAVTGAIAGAGAVAGSGSGVVADAVSDADIDDITQRTFYSPPLLMADENL